MMVAKTSASFLTLNQLFEVVRGYLVSKGEWETAQGETWQQTADRLHDPVLAAWAKQLSYMTGSVDRVYTATEAALRWNLSLSTVRKACVSDRFTDEECRQSGGTWLVTHAGMLRLYGELEEKG